jgi:hypothetical protein
MTPNNENGANDFKFFMRHNGNKTSKVKVTNVGFRDVSKRLENVDPRTIE